MAVIIILWNAVVDINRVLGLASNSMHPDQRCQPSISCVPEADQRCQSSISGVPEADQRCQSSISGSPKFETDDVIVNE